MILRLLCVWSLARSSDSAPDLEGSVSLLQLPGSLKLVERDAEPEDALPTRSRCHSIDGSGLPSLPTDTEEARDHGGCSIRRSPQLQSLGFIQRADPAARPSVIPSSSCPSEIWEQCGDPFACAVSHKHKFIYLHVPKNAGTTSEMWLRDALCGATRGDCDPCSLEFLDCEASLSQFSNYVRWSWVRHPYDRAVSIYSMAISEEMALVPEAQQLTLAEFWSQSGPWLSEHRSNLTNLSYHHGLPQSAFVADEAGCLAVDFLGSLDRADEDLARLAGALGAQELLELLEARGFALEEGDLRNFGGELQEEEGLSAKQMVEAAPELKAFLDEYYAADFALLGAAQ